MKRRHFLGATALGLLPHAGRAQAFPERPLRFVVPYAPGGSTDTSARIVAEKLASALGQPVVVENKPGGGTIIGTETVAKARPDGHTVLLTPAAMIAIAAFGVSVPYDIDKDLVPIVGFVDLRERCRSASPCRPARPSRWSCGLMPRSTRLCLIRRRAAG